MGPPNRYGTDAEHGLITLFGYGTARRREKVPDYFFSYGGEPFWAELSGKLVGDFKGFLALEREN